MRLISAKEFVRDAWSGLKREGSFSQNYAVVLSGTGLNILIQIFVAPILTRLYGPEAYGVFSIFNALCTNLALVAGLRFSQALLLPRQEQEFTALLRLSFLSILLFSIVIFIALFFLASNILSLLQAEKLLHLYFLIPVGVFLIAMNQVIGQWQYRLNVFKKSVAIDTSILIGVRGFNVLFGWFSKGVIFGLLLGDMLGKATGLLLGWKLVIKENIQQLFASVPIDQLKKTFLAYKQYPLYNLPGVWLTTFSEQLPIFFLSASFGLQTVGLLSLAVSMMDLPKRLFAYSVSSVFYKRAVELKDQSEIELRKFVLKILYFLFAISILPYATVVVFGQELFSFVFGNEWLVSGRLAQYLAVYYIFELLYISMDSIYYVLRQEKRMFVFQAITLGGRFAVLAYAMYVGLGIEQCIILLGATNFILYTSQLSYILHLLKVRWLKHILLLVGLFFSAIALLYGVKQIFIYLMR